MDRYVGVWKDRKSGKVKEMNITAISSSNAYRIIRERITRPSLLGNIQYPVMLRVFKINGPSDFVSVTKYKSSLESYKITEFDKPMTSGIPLTRKQRIIKGIVQRLRN